MQVAEASLKLIKEMQTTREESVCMEAYFNALNVVENMKKELKDFPNKKSTNYKLKEKRVKVIEESIHAFYKCYFDMSKYKEGYALWKQRAIEKEIEFNAFINKF